MENVNADKIQKQIDAFERALKESAKEIGETSKVFFDKTFDEQGFTDRNFKAWEPDKENTGKILEKTGRLRRGNRTEVTEDTIKTTNDTPYAKFVNDGTSKMRGRKFLGESETLKEKILGIINNKIKSIFR